MVVYFSPHAKSESPGREAYPLLHGYNPLLTGNPATVASSKTIPALSR